MTISTRQLIEAVNGHERIVDLARQYSHGMPQSPNHPPFRHAYTRRHGDMVRADGGSAAADMLTMGTHVGTHMDALAHVSHDGRVHGGVSTDDCLDAGLYRSHGIHQIPPFVGRGVMLDIPAVHGLDICAAGYEITPEDLAAAVLRQGTAIEAGDAVLIRSGWARNWEDGAAYCGSDSGVPGVGEAGATWLVQQGAALVGADTIAFECLPAGQGHALLPAHRVLLVEAGVPIMETMDLEELAESQAYEFAFVVTPLNLLGATGSPIRPLAILGRDR